MVQTSVSSVVSRLGECLLSCCKFIGTGLPIVPQTQRRRSFGHLICSRGDFTFATFSEIPVRSHWEQTLLDFLQNLNGIHLGIPITMKIKENEILPFLDVLVSWKLGHTVYRKTTHTDISPSWFQPFPRIETSNY